MTLDLLRKLAAHHGQQARLCERQANTQERQARLLRSQSLGHASAAQRRLAQFHASSAIHLSELADAFDTFADPLSAITSGPNAAPDNSSIPTTTTPTEEKALPLSPKDAGAGA